MTSPIETNNVVEREPRYFGIPLSEMCRTAREAPGRLGNSELKWLADTAQSLSDRINVLEGERKQLLERQRQYRSHLQIVPMLLGPKAWELWSGWVDKEWLPTMLYQHYSWGPKARPGDGEAIAQMLLNVRDDIASGNCKPLDFDDASLTQGGKNG